jgi:hypothetical protein
VILLVLRILLFLFTVFGALFSAMFDSPVTGLLYAAATILALVGIFKPWASAAALGCIGIAALTSWGGGNPGH